MTPTLADWPATVLSTIDFLRRPGERLNDVLRLPARDDGDQSDRLHGLLELRRRLRMGEPTKEALRQWASQLAAWLIQQDASVRSAAVALAEGIDGEIEALLKQGAQSPDAANRCLLREDFGDSGVYALPAQREMLFGAVSRLPPSHWGRDLVPEPELYQLGGTLARCPCLALGAESERWYPAAEVIALTRNWRRHQIQDDEQREMADRTRAANERYRLEQSEAGRIARLEEQLAQTTARLAEVEARDAKKNGKATVPNN